MNTNNEAACQVPKRTGYIMKVERDKRTLV